MEVIEDSTSKAITKIKNILKIRKDLAFGLLIFQDGNDKVLKSKIVSRFDILPVPEE